MISTLLYVLRSKIWSMLVNVLFALEKKVYSVVVGWSIHMSIRAT